jgi:hypothetical protein
MRFKIDQMTQTCACVLLLTISWCVWDLTQHIKQTADAVVAEVAQTRIDTVAVATSTQNQLFEQVAELRSDTFGFLNSVNTQLNRRLSSIESNTFARIDRIENKTFDQVAAIATDAHQLNASAAALLDAYKKPADSLNQLIQSNDKYFNCDRNALCWSNQTASSLRQIERSATNLANSIEQINKTTPKFVSSVEQFSRSFNQNAPAILNNTNDITKNISRLTKPRWYDRAIGWGVNGSLIYFNMNRR